VYVITRTNTLLVESEAMIHLGTLIGGPWAIAARVIRVVPRGLRNSIYQWTSRNRYRWFGKRSTCRVPTPEERSRFL
jgi:predicted DCC family thiol-disulfide oxidoreductase YuxK